MATGKVPARELSLRQKARENMRLQGVKYLAGLKGILVSLDLYDAALQQFRDLEKLINGK